MFQIFIINIKANRGDGLALATLYRGHDTQLSTSKTSRTGSVQWVCASGRIGSEQATVGSAPLASAPLSARIDSNLMECKVYDSKSF